MAPFAHFRNGLRAAAIVALVAALFSLGASAWQGGDEPKGKTASSTKKAAIVPFEMLPSNHMVVKARLNGKGPYDLIFDLGAPVTLLNSKVAEASGAIPADAPRSFLFGVRGEGSVDRLELGDLEARNVPVIVMDHPALKVLGQAFKRPLDGIVGYTFFARYKMAIDYQKLEMSFIPVRSEVPNLIKDLPERLLGPKEAQHLVLAPLALWGITLGPAPEHDPSARGVPIQAILPGSPAAAAGLQSGDIVTAIDGRWTASLPDTYAAAAKVSPGQPVAVNILRDGQELTLQVKPAEGI